MAQVTRVFDPPQRKHIKGIVVHVNTPDDGATYEIEADLAVSFPDVTGQHIDSHNVKIAVVGQIKTDLVALADSMLAQAKILLGF